MDIHKLAHANDFAFETSIGKLWVGPVTVGHEREMSKRFPRGATADPTEYARFLLSQIGGRRNDESQDPIPLSVDEVGKLTGEDLDKFANQYIERNKLRLFRDPERKSAMVEMPRQEGEDVKVYLRRLRDASTAREVAHLRKLMGKALPKSLSSDLSVQLFAKNQSMLQSLEKHLSANSQMQEAIRKFNLMGPDSELQKAVRSVEGLNALRHIQPDVAGLVGEIGRSGGPGPASLVGPTLPPLPPHPPNPIHKTNETLAIVASQIEAVNNVSTETAKLVSNMNELGLSMATSSAAHAERTANQNKWMIGIAVFAIVASSGFSIWTSYQDRERDIATTILLKQATGQLEVSQGAFAEAQRSADAQRAALQKELEAQRAELQAQLKAMDEERERREKRARSVKK